MKLTDALSKIKTIAETLPDDDPDKIEMMDIEGDYSALCEWALRKNAEFKVFEASCKELSNKYKERGAMFLRKQDNMRDILGMLLRSANERKYVGVSGTVSLSVVAPKPIISDEGAVPDRFKKTTVTIDKVAINKAVKDGETIAGVTMDNGGESIRIG